MSDLFTLGSPSQTSILQFVIVTQTEKTAAPLLLQGPGKKYCRADKQLASNPCVTARRVGVRQVLCSRSAYAPRVTHVARGCVRPLILTSPLWSLSSRRHGWDLGLSCCLPCFYLPAPGYARCSRQSHPMKPSVPPPPRAQASGKPLPRPARPPQAGLPTPPPPWVPPHAPLTPPAPAPQVILLLLFLWARVLKFLQARCTPKNETAESEHLYIFEILPNCRTDGFCPFILLPPL